MALVSYPFKLLLLTFVFISGGQMAIAQMRGPLPDEQREIIQYMAAHHDELSRVVAINKNGYSATTASKNEVLSTKLKKHFAYMQKRVGSGAMVRRWDPAYAELVEYYDQIEVNVEYLDNGIRVVFVGTTPEGVKVAQNHAQIVTGFTNEGSTALRKSHAKALKE